MAERRAALVTGGSRGIGRATALALAEAGLDVAVTYKKNEAAARDAAAAIEKRGVTALVLAVDLEDRAGVAAALQRVEADFGQLDVLVANAAATAFKPLLDVGEHHLSRTMTTSLQSFIQLVQGCVPLMAGRPGSVVAVSGWDSYRSLSRHGLLGAAKAGLEALVRSFAVELASRDIAVNAVCPGPVDTDSARYYAGATWPQMEANWVQRTPAGRLGRPEDIATIIRFLSSPDSRWLRGQVLYADGGLSLMTEPAAWFEGGVA
jgi:enoyl-[acyl-carrier protein] reductase III